jgi:hypothetical protein
MILTPLNIQIAIIKAWYSIALKSIKYYGGLAVGINNSCLLKEARLLRAYVDILKNFEIVGDKTVCSCCIEGDYTVLLNDLSELTEAKIQFGCDDTGSMYYDNISYPFVYSYDSNNKKIVIQFSTLINPSTDDPYILNLDDVNFTEDCSFEPGTVSPIEVAVIDEVTDIPVTADNIYGDWGGNITIYEDDGITVLHQRTISVDIIDDPQAIVDYWNTNGPEEWLLLYDGTQYTMLTPFDGTDYSGYTVVFSQYEGGQDSLALRTSFIPQAFVPLGTRASTVVDIPNTFVGSVQATSTIQPAVPQPFITTPEQASTILEIQTDIFSDLGSKASAQFTARDTFFKCDLNVNYIYSPSFNVNWFILPRAATLSFADIEECITYINNNLSFGYPLELVSTSTVSYPTNVPASATTAFFNFSTFATGDVIDIALTSNYYLSYDVVGTYTVLLGDTNENIVAGLIADIISQGLFAGTVTTDVSNYLYFTAPVGTGSDWNAVYYMSITNTTTNSGTLTYFINGNNLTENEYVLSVTAPTEGSSFNSYFSYVNFGYNNTFYTPLTGGSDPSTVFPVEVTDAIDGVLYSIPTNTFTSVNDFITAFNAVSSTQATNIGGNGIYTQVEFKPPLTDTNNFVYNTTLLNFSFNSIIVASNNYFGGIDTTECTYLLQLYNSSNVLISPVIENTTPTNYSSVLDIATDIQGNAGNTYIFGIGVNTNDEITTSYPDPQSLICDTYNGYYFKLFVDYASTQYSNYLSEDSFIGGGINAVSNPFVISDTENGIIFQKTLDSYNYPNGSEIENGFVPDFNANNTGALPLLYSAEYVSAGNPILSVPAEVINPFYSNFAGTVGNGSDVKAFIDTPSQINLFIGEYRTPISGALPPLNTMINNITNSIITNNAQPGLLATTLPGVGIQLTAPSTTGSSYNTKPFKIKYYDYVKANETIAFGAATPGANFILRGLAGTIICSILLDVSQPIYNSTQVATIVDNAINSLGPTSGFSSIRIGNSVRINAPDYTGASYNVVFLVLNVLTGSSLISINSNTYSPGTYILGTFSSGQTNIIDLNAAPDDVYFSGGIDAISTTRVRFFTPTQPLTSPEYGTGNWIYNFVPFTYNYNASEYELTNGYIGGIDPTVGQFTVELLDPLSVLQDTLYNDAFPQNYLSKQALVDSFNADPNNLDFQIALPIVGNLTRFLSPPDSFDYFNNYIFRYSYDYVSPQYADYEDIDTAFINGLDPVLTPYEGTFEEGDIGTFVTDNPCTPETVEQTCLSNKDVSKIIAHIDKLVR